MSLEARCTVKYSRIVRLRANGRCELTVESGVAAHHIKFKSQCTLEERFDTMLGIYLSFDVHTGGEGPHGLQADNKEFIDRVIKAFRASNQSDLIERADYIEEMQKVPQIVEAQLKMVALTIINMRLSEELRVLKETKWMDSDIER